MHFFLSLSVFFPHPSFFPSISSTFPSFFIYPSFLSSFILSIHPSFHLSIYCLFIPSSIHPSFLYLYPLMHSSIHFFISVVLFFHSTFLSSCILPSFGIHPSISVFSIIYFFLPTSIHPSLHSFIQPFIHSFIHIFLSSIIHPPSFLPSVYPYILSDSLPSLPAS